MWRMEKLSGQGLVGRLSRTSPVGCSSTSNEFLVPHRLWKWQADKKNLSHDSEIKLRNWSRKHDIGKVHKSQRFDFKKKKRTTEFVELNPPQKKNDGKSTETRALCTLCADKAARQAICTVHLLRATGSRLESHAIVQEQSLSHKWSHREEKFMKFHPGAMFHSTLQTIHPFTFAKIIVVNSNVFSDKFNYPNSSHEKFPLKVCVCF